MNSSAQTSDSTHKAGAAARKPACTAPPPARPEFSQAVAIPKKPARITGPISMKAPAAASMKGNQPCHSSRPPISRPPQTNSSEYSTLTPRVALATAQPRCKAWRKVAALKD